LCSLILNEVEDWIEGTPLTREPEAPEVYRIRIDEAPKSARDDVDAVVDYTLLSRGTRKKLADLPSCDIPAKVERALLVRHLIPATPLLMQDRIQFRRERAALAARLLTKLVMGK